MQQHGANPRRVRPVPHPLQKLRLTTSIQSPRPTTVFSFASNQGNRGREPRALFLLFPLQLQLILQSWHDFMRTIEIKPRALVAAQPPGTAAALVRRIVDVKVLLDRSREQLAQLRTR